ncbi:MAG TPA: radical SAM protein [Lachnospiraceae bacterium]|nr:radical SAM protein [Lachnospiraceae bacterium]
MKIGRVFAPVFSLGPGKRICMWTQGCSKKCFNCISPELQDGDMPDIPVQQLARIILGIARQNHCSRLTISGGDPFEQAKELKQFLEAVRKEFTDILVYTGFTLGDIRSGVCGETGIRALSSIDVLIDGPYIDEENQPTYVLRGSGNQQIHYFNHDLRQEYEDYLSLGRQVETFSHDGNVVLVGILNRGE